jgi:hypothetical protein
LILSRDEWHQGQFICIQEGIVFDMQRAQNLIKERWHQQSAEKLQ